MGRDWMTQWEEDNEEALFQHGQAFAAAQGFYQYTPQLKREEHVKPAPVEEVKPVFSSPYGRGKRYIVGKQISFDDLPKIKEEEQQ